MFFGACRCALSLCARIRTAFAQVAKIGRRQTGLEIFANSVKLPRNRENAKNAQLALPQGLNPRARAAVLLALARRINSRKVVARWLAQSTTVTHKRLRVSKSSERVRCCRPQFTVLLCWFAGVQADICLRIGYNDAKRLCTTECTTENRPSCRTLSGKLAEQFAKVSLPSSPCRGLRV